MSEHPHDSEETDISATEALPATGSATGASTPASVPHEGRYVPGTVLASRYRIIGLIGRGGMGEVYRATDLTLNQQVALKFLPPEMASDEALLARFHNEVRIARTVSHPNVCRVYDVVSGTGSLPVFLSMEY